MTLQGILERTEVTGKGGLRGLYKPKLSESETREHIKRMAKRHINRL
jgi:hypothetical protein